MRSTRNDLDYSYYCEDYDYTKYKCCDIGKLDDVCDKCAIIWKQIDELKEQIKNNQISSISAFKLLRSMKVKLLSIEIAHFLASSYHNNDDIDSISYEQQSILDIYYQTEEIVDNCKNELELIFGDLFSAAERVIEDLNTYGCDFISITLTEEARIIVQNTNTGAAIIHDVETKGITTEKLETIIRDLTLEVLE